MTRRTALLFALALLLAPCLCFAAEEGQAPAQVVTVRIYNTGDLHEHSANLPRIAAFIKKAKKESRNVLFIDAGDFTNKGEREMAVTRGEGMFALMSECAYDACVLGNHDYSFGMGRILELHQKYPKFPLVLANMKWTDEQREKAKGIPRCKVFELEGVKVAVVGTASRYMNHAKGAKIPFFGEPAAFRQVIPEAKKRADIVVAVTHLLEQDDFNTLEYAEGAVPDVLIGAHSHAILSKMHEGTFIQKSGFEGRWLGEVTIQWDGKKIVSIKGRAIPVKPEWAEDADVAALRAKFFEQAPKAPKKELLVPAAK